MSAIGDNFNSGFKLSQMVQGINDKFKAADTDGNDAISKQEFVHAMEESGFNTNKMDKIFNRMDRNGDGQVSQSEHQEILSFMEQRLGSLMNREGGIKQGFDGVQSLIALLQNDSDSGDKKQRLQEMLGKMRSESYKELTSSEPLSRTNSTTAGINTSA